MLLPLSATWERRAATDKFPRVVVSFVCGRYAHMETEHLWLRLISNIMPAFLFVPVRFSANAHSLFLQSPQEEQEVVPSPHPNMADSMEIDDSLYR